MLGAVCFTADISTVICDVPEKARMILDCVSGKARVVKMIILIEAFDSDLVTRAKENGIEILSLKELEVRIRIGFVIFEFHKCSFLMCRANCVIFCVMSAL